MGTIFVRMDGAMGRDDAIAPKYAEENRLCGVSAGVRFARHLLWHPICTESGVDVWNELGGHEGLDYGRLAMGRPCDGGRQYASRFTDCASCDAAQQVNENTKPMNVTKTAKNFDLLFMILQREQICFRCFYLIQKSH